MTVTRRHLFAQAGAISAAAGLQPFIAAAAASTDTLRRPGGAGRSASTAPAASAGGTAGGGGAPTGGGSAAAELYPTQAPEEVRELVRVAHFDLARVRALVERRPALARASWDWGFGDWESALGAASHMGNRPIAEVLLAHGARPDLFSAAMLGQLEVVKAWVVAWPGAQGIRGPHGITLLAHARAGGAAAKPVLQYLTELGDADPVLPLAPLAPEDRQALLGSYGYGSRAGEVFLVEAYQDSITVTRAGGMARPLLHLGSRVFSPMGAEAVRIRFSGEAPAATFTVHDPDLVITAHRVTA